MSVNLEIFNAYNNGLITGDFPAVFETMADDIIWHQPGQHSNSGTVVGKKHLEHTWLNFQKKQTVPSKY